LQADEFAVDVYRKLNGHLEIIRDEMQQHVLRGETDAGQNDLTVS
jgi:hypothetical protein